MLVVQISQSMGQVRSGAMRPPLTLQAALSLTWCRGSCSLWCIVSAVRPKWTAFVAGLGC